MANSASVELADARILIRDDPEGAARLLVSLVAAVAELTERVARLEGRSSQNTHLPPSMDPPGAPPRPVRPVSGRRRGGQPGHPGHTRELVADPDSVVVHRPARCRGCRRRLVAADLSLGERRQVWEIPAARAVVVEHQLVDGHCQRCGVTTRATLPVGTPQGAFGANLEAAVTRLVAVDRLSHRAVCRILRDLHGVRLSAGTITRILTRAADALTETVTAIDSEIRRSPVLHVDETGWRVAGKRHWLWCASTRSLIRIQVSASRGQEACKHLIGPSPPGIIVSDRWAGYNHLPNSRRQACLSHVVRDCRAVSQCPGERAVIGTRLLAHLAVVFEHWHTHQHDATRDALAAALAPTINAFTNDLKALQATGPNPQASFATNLLNLGSALWTFTTTLHVDPTNNHAERSLRPLVIHRKTSYGNQTDHGRHVYETIQTVVQTLALRRENINDRLRDAVTAANHNTPLNLIATP